MSEEKERPGESTGKSEGGLRKAAMEVFEMLSNHKPRKLEIPEGLHPNPPFVPKAVFTKLGDLIKVAEKLNSDKIAGNKWITLRLDGKGFGKYVRRLQRLGIFESNGGYSKEFARIMKECLLELMSFSSAACGYTQSDEMTVLIPPTSIVRGIQQPHMYNGRVQKIGTLAASKVTSLFNLRVIEKCVETKTKLDPTILAQFDCRVGKFETLEEALSLVAWRAYDCGVNGVSDAVHKAKKSVQKEGKESISRKNAKLLDTGKKLKWLYERKLLPLPSHQARGSFYVRTMRLKTAFNPKLNKEVECLRSVIDEVKNKDVLSLIGGKTNLQDLIMPAKPTFKKD
ncbi:hypothetical protein AAMO2058_001040200 [Amorphochlora amoebiformis]